jgi:hypothetical protein
MLIRMMESASWLIIYLSCFISLSADIVGSTYHDCFSHLPYIITFNIYLHVVFIQRCQSMSTKASPPIGSCILRFPCQLQIKLTSMPMYTSRVEIQDLRWSKANLPDLSCVVNARGFTAQFLHQHHSFMLFSFLQTEPQKYEAHPSIRIWLHFQINVLVEHCVRFSTSSLQTICKS